MYIEGDYLKRIRALIEKDTLRYIIEGKKVSNEYIIANSKCRLDQLERWLDVSVDVFPTITQAKRLSSCLHIPFAALYMNKEDIKIKEIPRTCNRRTLQDSNETDSSLVNIVLTDIINERDFLVDARKDLGIAFTPFDANVPTSNDSIEWANEIRRFFELDMNVQYGCRNTREFFLYLRNQIEKKGIFVHCFKEVDIEIIRGIAIYDQTMPMIGINIKDRQPAKSFSIIHEVVHLYKRQSSLCNDMCDSFSAEQEEVFCNAVAGELLVPTNELNSFLPSFPHIDDEMEPISFLANRFSASKDVIIRRLLDTGKINREMYLSFCETLKAKRDERKGDEEKVQNTRKPKKNKRNMSKIIIDRTSSAICRVLYEGYCENIYDAMDISNYLDLSIDQVDYFLKEVAKWDN